MDGTREKNQAWFGGSPTTPIKFSLFSKQIPNILSRKESLIKDIVAFCWRVYLYLFAYLFPLCSEGLTSLLIK